MDCAEDGSEATAGGSHYGDTEEALRDIVNPPFACAFFTRRRDLISFLLGMQEDEWREALIF